MLCRVSTRSQENKGESLFNQDREIVKWAEAHGIAIRRKVEVAESGGDAVELQGAQFVFNRRAEYTELIVEYQAMKPAERPNAIVIDWLDRWSRSVFEFNGLKKAFRALGIRMLAIGNELDVTDPKNDLVTNILVSIGEEQLRIVQGKVGEARRSRRQRGKWQGCSCPDGYRTHAPECPGLTEVLRENAKGEMKAFKVRSCGCSPVVLRRDPDREATILEAWRLLDTSTMTWQGMADEMNARGFHLPDGRPFKWYHLYRMGENPHYAGIMTTERTVRVNPYSKKFKHVTRLDDWQLNPDTDCIPEPYVRQELFWDIRRRRFSNETRFQCRSKAGSASELTGLLFCPQCDRLMSSWIAYEKKKPGVPPSERRRRIYMECRRSGSACANKKRVRVDVISKKLIELLAELTVMSDSAIAAAMQLRQSTDARRVLEAERRRLIDAIATAENSRHGLTKLLASGALTQAEVEEELFDHRRDRTQAQTRLAEVERELRQTDARTDFDQARTAIGWLRDQWDLLTAKERAETLRLLVERVSYMPNGRTHPEKVHIVRYGRAFVDPSSIATEAGSLRTKGA